MSQDLQYLTDERGRKTAVVMPLKDYEKMVEDMEDLAVIAERRNEETISHEALKKSLKRKGLSH